MIFDIGRNNKSRSKNKNGATASSEARVREVLYSDERNDDFAGGAHHDAAAVDGGYRYSHGPVWQLSSFVLYRLIATPVAYSFCRLRFGVKIKGKKNLRGLRGGYFLYGNHTQGAADAFIPTLITFPRRCDIVCGREAVSIPIIKHVVPLVGGIPLGSTVSGCRNFSDALGERIRSGHAVAIYPEAHIWPYCNYIRDYPSGSFMYPHKMEVPAVGFTVTYRRRRGLLSKLPPLITVTVGRPVMPGEYESRDELRGMIHGFMTDTVNSEGSCEYIRYSKKTS